MVPRAVISGNSTVALKIRFWDGNWNVEAEIGDVVEFLKCLITGNGIRKDLTKVKELIAKLCRDVISCQHASFCNDNIKHLRGLMELLFSQGQCGQFVVDHNIDLGWTEQQRRDYSNDKSLETKSFLRNYWRSRPF
jgi:hypothetical protein